MADIGAGMGGAGFGERNGAGQEDSDLLFNYSIGLLVLQVIGNFCNSENQELK